MAKATLLNPKPSVQLNLTHDEAQFLRDVMHYIGGSTQTRRHHADAIARAFEEVDILGTDKHDVNRMNASIYFVEPRN